MSKEINWIDLYIKDFGGSQIEDKALLSKCQKKMRTFYVEFLLPLYEPAKKSQKFKFSVPDELLTCRIMLEDLRQYHGLNNMQEVLDKIAENSESLTQDKASKLIEIMKRKKEERENAKNR